MITKKNCPKCGSDDVISVSKGMVGSNMCRNCGFVGNMIERPFIGSDKKFGGMKK